MKTYEIECGEGMHTIGMSDDGKLHLFDHDVEEQETMHIMGLETSKCFRVTQAAEKATPEMLSRLFLGALYRKLLDEMSFYLDCGADVHLEDETALYWAASQGHTRIVERLLEHGANAKHEVFREFEINGCKYLEVNSPLLEAEAKRRHKVVELLLKAGAKKRPVYE